MTAQAPTVAALYVEKNGVYAGLPGVEVWDEERDARNYAGPWPVVAHPPCARWSRLAGFTEARFGLKRGEDGGCFAAALASVRKFGGVIEHPAYTDAFAAFDLPRPTVREGWTLDIYGGASCYVEQGRYGLPVKKATWLYAYGVELPQLRWGYVRDGDGDGDGGMDAWRDRFGGRRGKLEQGGSHFAACVVDGVRVKSPHFGLTTTTPPAFRDVLLAMARTAVQQPDMVADCSPCYPLAADRSTKRLVQAPRGQDSAVSRSPLSWPHTAEDGRR